jgi:ribosome maturation factor RimP
MNEIEENMMIKINELLTNDISAIHVGIFSNSGVKNIQIMIESEKGITVDDCVDTSRLAEDIITMHKFVDDNYNIEVSSPGINRPLFNIKDFIKFQGEKVFIELKRNINNQRRFKGYYEVIEDLICIKDKKETIEISFNDIKKANLVREIKI